MSDLRQDAIDAIGKLMLPHYVCSADESKAQFNAGLLAAMHEIGNLLAAELTCDGCKYNVGGMLYQPCTECARSAVDNWTAEDEE